MYKYRRVSKPDFIKSTEVICFQSIYVYIYNFLKILIHFIVVIVKFNFTFIVMKSKVYLQKI